MTEARPPGRTGRLALGALAAVLCCLVATLGVLSHSSRQWVVLKDALDSEVDRLVALSAAGHSKPGHSPGRWHHIDPQQLAAERALERAKTANGVAYFSNMPPEGHLAYSPSDHLLARGSGWLTRDGEQAPLLEEAKRVLGSYNGDVKAKGGVDWKSIGPDAFKPVPLVAPPGVVEGHEGMRAAMDSVNSHVYGQPDIPVFSRDQASRVARSSADIAAIADSLSRDRVAAYVAAHKGKGQSSAVVNAMISEYMKKMREAAQRRSGNEGAYERIRFDRIDREIPVRSGVGDTAGSMRDARIRRAAEEAAAAEAEEATAQAVAYEAANEAASFAAQVESRMKHTVHDAVQPLDARIAAMEAKIAADAASSPAASHVPAPHTASSAGGGGGGRMSFHVPGPITIDHLQLPGGDYSLHIGADANMPAYPPGGQVSRGTSSAPSAASSSSASLPPAGGGDGEREDAGGDTGGGSGYPEGVLDKKKDLKVDRDDKVIQDAASELQRKVVADFEAGVESGSESDKEGKAKAEGEDGYPEGVINKKKEMRVQTDEAATKKAAMDLQKTIVEQNGDGNKEGGTKAEGEDGYPEGVINKKKEMRMQIDEAAAQKAAMDLQKTIVEQKGGVSDKEAGDDNGNLDSATGMDRGVDKDAVQAAAASLQESVIQGSGSKSPVVANAQAESDKGAQNDEDVMDSSTDTSSNVDEAAMRVAAQHLQENVVNDNTEDEHEHAAGASASTTSAGSEASAGGTDDGVLVWATASDRGVDSAAVHAAADSILHHTLDSLAAPNTAPARTAPARTAPARTARGKEVGEDLLDSTTRMTRSDVDKAAVARAVDSIEQQIARDRVSTSLDKASALAQAQVRARVRAARRVHTAGHNGLKAGGARMEMLSDTMLMPVNIYHDVKDAYNDPVGGTEHARDIKSMYGSFERSNRDKQKMLQIKNQEDTMSDQPDVLRPHNFAGGVGTKAHVHPAGEQMGAWYSSWWEHPNVQDLEEETQEMFGLTSDLSGEPKGTDDGKRMLIMQGLNVNGWEPGRTAKQVREDHLHHKQVSPGFWNDDGTEAEAPDLSLHHPCGSPLRKRPCDGETTTPPGPGTGNLAVQKADRHGIHRVPVHFDAEAHDIRRPIWVDPMPLEVLCKGRNATWCEEEEGGEGDQGSE